MCGLAGVVDLAGTRRPDAAMLQRMGDALWHRGPDDDGFLIEPGIGLAHRRLSIVGADNGPMLHLLKQRGAELTRSGAEVDAVLPLAAIVGQLAEHPLSRQLLRTVPEGPVT